MREASRDESSVVKTQVTCGEELIPSSNFRQIREGAGEYYARRMREVNTIKEDVFAKQEGGNHYQSLTIQPTEYIHKNGLDWCEGNIVKYITRHKQKGGEKDLKKVIHYAELEMQLVYGET